MSVACRVGGVQDVEPGCAVDPMKASAELSVGGALGRMEGKPYVAEIKLDGERLVVSGWRGWWVGCWGCRE